MLQLLEDVVALKAENAALREEIARLKGLKGPPKLKPSGMEKATEPARAERKAGRRGGKIDRLVIDEERVLKAAVPPGSRFKGYETYVVQELILRPHVIGRYRRERWITPDGRTVAGGSARGDGRPLRPRAQALRARSVSPGLFIVDGAKALSKAIRNTFGVAAAIQRCQVHKGRNIIERLPQHLHASVKKALRQAWDQDDANKAERLLRNLVRRLEHEEPGVSGSILEGLEEILTVIRLGLPHELRRSLACTNIVENALGTVRQVTRNVKRWRHAEMALRWTAAGLLEAQKTFRRLKAYRQLPILRNALQEHLRKAQADSAIETIMKAA